MASVLTDFTKKREFLVCMDSDGCVMDTVSIKHTIVMCPELIRVLRWTIMQTLSPRRGRRFNLRNITRGLSRFESVVLVFDRLKNRGIEIPGSEDIAAWVDTANELFYGQPAAGAAKNRQPGPAQIAGVEQCLQPPHPGLGADV